MTMNRDQCLLCKSCIYFSGHIAKACTTHIRAPNANPQFCNKWVLMVGLFFSVDIMVFDFLYFVFFQVKYIHYCWKHYVERLRRNFY